MAKSQVAKDALETVRPARIFMCPDDIGLFYGKLIGTKSGIYKHWQAMRDVLQLPARQRVTIYQFADYEGLPLETVIAVINASEL